MEANISDQYPPGLKLVCSFCACYVCVCQLIYTNIDKKAFILCLLLESTTFFLLFGNIKTGSEETEKIIRDKVIHLS